ncbi:MAG: cutinase family protein [Acidimicrobiia bacterium]|nr:cutinase family protein [Acidimicrobiia bacterium]
MAQAYFDQVETRLPGYSINEYELGTRDYGGYRYRAVGISAILDLYRTNIIRIIWSLIWRISRQDGSHASSGSDLLEIDGLGALEYRNSVIEGIGEFTAYLEDRGTDCPDEMFLVGGFSQGAQVIRRSLFLLGKGNEGSYRPRRPVQRSDPPPPRGGKHRVNRELPAGDWWNGVALETWDRRVLNQQRTPEPRRVDVPQSRPSHTLRTVRLQVPGGVVVRADRRSLYR